MLDGIRVLDLSRVIAGPYCATLMADLGADVVKVERPGRGDDLRAWRGAGMSATFAAINRNKRGIAVDLQQPGRGLGDAGHDPAPGAAARRAYRRGPRRARLAQGRDRASCRRRRRRPGMTAPAS